jgi:hypothetical protein
VPVSVRNSIATLALAYLIFAEIIFRRNVLTRSKTSRTFQPK